MPSSAPPKNLFVLVVEDEPLQRMMAIDLVEDAGFETIEAANADDAIRILEQRSDIQAVITDVDMPGSMDGLKLACAIRDRWPPIKIIVISGHLRGQDVELPEGGVFFSKPYDPERVARKLSDMVSPR